MIGSERSVVQDIGSVGRRRLGVSAERVSCLLYNPRCSRTSSSRRHHEVVSPPIHSCHRHSRRFQESPAGRRGEEHMETSQAPAHCIGAQVPATAEGISEHKLCEPEQLWGTARGQRARWLAQQGVLRGRVHLPARRLGGEGGRGVRDGLCEAVLRSVRECLSRCHRNQMRGKKFLLLLKLELNMKIRRKSDFSPEICLIIWRCDLFKLRLSDRFQWTFGMLMVN